jgi:hypothetical protein
MGNARCNQESLLRLVLAGVPTDMPPFQDVNPAVSIEQIGPVEMLNHIATHQGGGTRCIANVIITAHRGVSIYGHELRFGVDAFRFELLEDPRKIDAPYDRYSFPGRIDFDRREVINHRIRWVPAGHFIEGLILARSVQRIPTHYVSGGFAEAEFSVCTTLGDFSVPLQLWVDRSYELDRRRVGRPNRSGGLFEGRTPGHFSEPTLRINATAQPTSSSEKTMEARREPAKGDSLAGDRERNTTQICRFR